MLKRAVAIVSLLAFLTLPAPARADDDGAILITALVVGGLVTYIAIVFIASQATSNSYAPTLSTIPPLGDSLASKREGLRLQPGCGQDPRHFNLVCW